MVVQKIEKLISLKFDEGFKIWIHPTTGVLLYNKNDKKISIHNNIALVNQLPPDFVLELPSNDISIIAFGSKFFSIAFLSGEILLIDNYSYVITSLKKSFKKPINLLSISPNNLFLLVYTDEEKLFSFDIEKEKIFKEYKIKEKNLSSFVWMNESKFVCVTVDGSIHVWDHLKGQETKVIKKAHNSKITVVINHPRNVTTILTGDFSGEIKIWDLEENKIFPDLVNSFQMQNKPVSTIKSSLTGKSVIAGDSNGFMRLFDMRGIRSESSYFFISMNEPLNEIVTLPHEGEFFTIHNNGVIKFHQGFEIENVISEYQIFQDEIQTFEKNVSQLPSWIQDDSLEFVLPNEIPIIEKQLDFASKVLASSLLEKVNTSFWMKENFKEIFKNTFILEKKIKNVIDKIREMINKTRNETSEIQETTNKLREELLQYFANSKPGKISFDQINLYFNSKTELLLPILQYLEQNKLVNGSIKSEYTGYFFELYSTQENDTENSEIKDANSITCHNCGTDYDINKKSCPNCNSESINCENCSKPIQKRQTMLNCPHCKCLFHLSCFESKVKLFGRCPKCRETVDFESLIRKTVKRQKHQDQIVSGLSRLLSKKSEIHKKVEEPNSSDDDLFDF